MKKRDNKFAQSALKQGNRIIDFTTNSSLKNFELIILEKQG
ncbi:hypothetical protein [Wolbachia endosymbiont of Litomosoides brasiliensis]|nr:hypothetical protein [Wolbachia endosymbiont of Litomosoides brasiliensis]